MRPLAGIPLKDFDGAKGRLSRTLSQEARRLLIETSALRAADAARTGGFDTVIVTGSAAVVEWAAGHSLATLQEVPGGGLDGAAERVVATAVDRGVPWCVIHADLPLIGGHDLRLVAEALGAGRAVLAPSRDGGTKVLAAREPVRFSYGPGSFVRHLAATAHLRPAVIVTPGLSIELDTAADLRIAASLPAGEWLGRFLSSPS